MIKKIAHLADIHIRKSISRHPEYRLVFKNLIAKLQEEKPDRIVIAGDLFNDYIKLEGEVLVLASEFINQLSTIAKVIITHGNHDIARSAPHRMNSVAALVKTMNNPNVYYLDKTFMFEDENLVWCIWRHGEKRNNPWTSDFKKNPDKTYIDLFHDPVNGSSNSEGFEFKSKTYHSLSDFKGDISMFGDIHKLQFLTPTKAYSSSLIAQNFGEGDDDFHGFIIWDVPTLTGKAIQVENPYGFYTLTVNQFTDFDNLQFHIENPVENKHLRIKWITLPAVRNTENMRKVNDFLEKKFEPLSIKHINEFIEEKKIKIDEKSDIENITHREVIHKVLSEYLTKIGVKPDIINEVLELDIEIENRLQLEEATNIQWSIVKLTGKNFRSYDEIEVDWDNQDGLYQIVGENGVGKSTINQLITYVLFGKSLETDFRKKFGDARFINNKMQVNFCEGAIILEANGEYYGIKRVTTTKKNKEGELTAASTVSSYYKLTTAEDGLDEQFNIEKLNEQDRAKTQERINEIIGSYENFIRVTLTTADTLNNVLSSDKALFIDSLLFDSGLNIFDLRLKEFKKYKEELIHDSRFNNFNVSEHQNQIISLNSDIKHKGEFIESQKDRLIVQNDYLNTQNKKKEGLMQSMHQIDPELASTNEIAIHSTIERLKQDLISLSNEETKLNSTIQSLKSTYDETTLVHLTEKKDNHKTEEFNKRTSINKIRLQIEQLNSNLIKINGDIERLKVEGGAIKKEIFSLENSKTCPTCGQEKNAETITKIKETIQQKETQMFAIVDQIKLKEGEKIPNAKSIENYNNQIASIEVEIKNDSIAFQSILEKIGQINNDKTEVEKRSMLNVQLSTYPSKKEVVELKINDQQNKLKLFNDQKTKIEENNKTKQLINEVNSEINTTNFEITTTKEGIVVLENQIKNAKETIILKEELINKYLDHEKKEEVRKIYAETIHRDGLPTQILIDTLLPNINNILSKLLETTDFDVYLDKDDLRLKLFYNEHPNAVIDCISASGMERTFAVYALKIALNQINSKSKSTLLTVDEVMGKLKGDYVDKFVELLHLSKKFYRKVVIIEPTHEVNPDYVLSIEKNEKHISKLMMA